MVRAPERQTSTDPGAFFAPKLSDLINFTSLTTLPDLSMLTSLQTLNLRSRSSLTALPDLSALGDLTVKWGTAAAPKRFKPWEAGERRAFSVLEGFADPSIVKVIDLSHSGFTALPKWLQKAIANRKAKIERERQVMANFARSEGVNNATDNADLMDENAVQTAVTSLYKVRGAELPLPHARPRACASRRARAARRGRRPQCGEPARQHGADSRVDARLPRDGACALRGWRRHSP